MPSPTTSTRPHPLILASILLLAIVFLATAVPAALHDRKPTEKTGDFTHFYHAALAMRNGQDIYTSGTGGYIYPPLIAFLFQPLSYMNEHHAAVTWDITNTLLTLLALLIAASAAAHSIFPTNTNPTEQNPPTQTLAPSPHTLSSFTLPIAALAALLAADKLRAIFTLGQTDCFMLLAFACTLRYMNKKPLLAGLLIGASAAIKYLTLIFVPYFLFKRNYKAALSSLLSFALFMFLPALELGLSTTLRYLATAFAGLAKMLGLAVPNHSAAEINGITWDRSVSITSTLFRLTRHFNLPDSLAAALTLLTLAAFLTTILLICRHRKIPLLQTARSTPAPLLLLEWSTLVFIAIAFSPQTTNRHMVLMLLIYAAGAAMLFEKQSLQSRITLATALLLMTAAQTLPPPGIGIDGAVWWWRAIGGASWCAMILMVVLTIHTTKRLSLITAN